MMNKTRYLVYCNNLYSLFSCYLRLSQTSSPQWFVAIIMCSKYCMNHLNKSMVKLSCIWYNLYDNNAHTLPSSTSICKVQIQARRMTWGLRYLACWSTRTYDTNTFCISWHYTKFFRCEQYCCIVFSWKWYMVIGFCTW